MIDPTLSRSEASMASTVESLLETVLSGASSPSPANQSTVDQSTAGVAAAGSARRTTSDDWIRSLVRTAGGSREQLRNSVAAMVASIDSRIGKQVNAVLHHPSFQRLEASWRGLYFLWEQVSQAQRVHEEAGIGLESQIKVKVLNLAREELRKDLTSALEFDQSQLFRKIYEEEFGLLGGEPFGLLVADYYFANHPEKDIELLEKLSGVAAAAFAPVVSGASPELLGLESFSELEQPVQLTPTFGRPDYIKWRSLREMADTRFLGLSLPRVLLRKPHRLDGSRKDGFRFAESTSDPNRSEFLWGNSCYAMASVVTHAFARSNWFADIRGVERADDESQLNGGGLVRGLPFDWIVTERPRLIQKNPLEVSFGSSVEQELSSLGFIPLCSCEDTPHSVYFSNASVHKPAEFARDPIATANAKLSAMLQYVLCASRFAHYLKVLARQKIGTFDEAQELERYLNSWLASYVTPDDLASQEVKAQYPLREARVEVRSIPGAPGTFSLIMYLRPHFQLDSLSAALRLNTRIILQT